MRKKQIAIMILSLWFIVISYLMLLVGRFELALFFILGFIGFLMIAELIEPHYVKPPYVRYIRYHYDSRNGHFRRGHRAETIGIRLLELVI